MATFFGEVLPVYSRAVDEDDEDDEINETAGSSSLRWSPKAREEIASSEKGCLHCTVLVIGIGPAATGFNQTYLMEGQDCDIMGVICSGMQDKDINSFSQQAPTDKTCYIYRLRDKCEMLIVQCNTQVSDEQAFSWVHELFTKISLDHLYVAVLTTALASSYKSDIPHGDLPTPFLRSLKTTVFKGTPTCPYLEQPNTASGLPAQILTYCQIHQVAAVLYSCYTDVSYVEPETMRAFQRILKCTPIRDFVIENPQADKQLAKLMELHAGHSTLYI